MSQQRRTRVIVRREEPSTESALVTIWNNDETIISSSLQREVIDVAEDVGQSGGVFPEALSLNETGILRAASDAKDSGNAAIATKDPQTAAREYYRAIALLRFVVETEQSTALLIALHCNLLLCLQGLGDHRSVVTVSESLLASIGRAQSHFPNINLSALKKKTAFRGASSLLALDEYERCHRALDLMLEGDPGDVDALQLRARCVESSRAHEATQRKALRGLFGA